MRRSVGLALASVMALGAAAAPHAATAQERERASDLPLVDRVGDARPRSYPERWEGLYAGLGLGYANGELGDIDDSGLASGLHAGFLLQQGPIHLGGEIERDFLRVEGLRHATRFKGIAGIDADQLFPYALAGAVRMSGDPGTSFGVTLGAGVTYRFEATNWRMGAEFNYDRVGDYDDSDDLDVMSVKLRASYAF